MKLLLQHLSPQAIRILDAMASKIAPAESIKLEARVLDAVASLLDAKADSSTITLPKMEFAYMSTMLLLGCEVVKTMVNEEHEAQRST